MTAIIAKESGLDQEFLSKIDETKDADKELYLTSNPMKYAIAAQEKVIKEIAKNGSCVIVGRAADYVLKDMNNVIKIFIHAPIETRIKNVMKMYNDKRKDAIRNIEKSDKVRKQYYEIIASRHWGMASNYDLTVDSSIGTNETANLICDYVNKRNLK